MISSMILSGVNFCTLSRVYSSMSSMLISMLLFHSRGCGRIVHMFTLFNSASAAPNCVPDNFLRRSNLRLAFVSTWQMCCFHVCCLSMLLQEMLHYLYIGVLCDSA